MRPAGSPREALFTQRTGPAVGGACLSVVPAVARRVRVPLAYACRHGHGHGTAAVSSLRRSAGRSGVRLHPRRDHRVALVGARLADPRPSPSQSVPDPADRARRRRDDVRGRDLALCRARRDPGAADHGAWLSLPSRGHRRLGGELHRGRGRGARRALRRGAQAAQGARRRAGDPARPREPRSSGCRRCAPICTRKASSRARAFAWRCAGCWR